MAIKAKIGKRVVAFKSPLAFVKVVLPTLLERGKPPVDPLVLSQSICVMTAKAIRSLDPKARKALTLLDRLNKAIDLGLTSEVVKISLALGIINLLSLSGGAGLNGHQFSQLWNATYVRFSKQRKPTDKVGTETKSPEPTKERPEEEPSREEEFSLDDLEDISLEGFDSPENPDLDDIDL